MVYDWVTSTAENADTAKLREITLGFPYIVSESGKTRVDFDKFQPTLLTLNKYPVMRAVINTAKETRDTKENAENEIREIVDNFNNTLKSGESERSFEGIIKIEERFVEPDPIYNEDDEETDWDFDEENDW